MSNPLTHLNLLRLSEREAATLIRLRSEGVIAPPSLDYDPDERPEQEIPGVPLGICQRCEGLGEVFYRYDYWGNVDTVTCPRCFGTGEEH